jgi:mono/diheme cytochrome c family protein
MYKPLMLLSAAILFGWATLPTLLTEPGQAAAPAAAPQTNPVKPTAESQARAKKIYTIDCEMCHAANGNGKSDLANDMKLKMLDWTDPASLAGISDAELFATIKNGKDKMPAEEGRAKPDEMWNLVIYIRNFSKGNAAAAPAPTGK